MSIRGLEGLSPQDLQDEVRRGGRFVVFSYTVSFLVVTLKRGSEVHFIRAGEGTFVKSLPYTLLSLVVGWWGFPWGFIYTPWSVIQNLQGGTNVTTAVLQSLAAPSAGRPESSG